MTPAAVPHDIERIARRRVRLRIGFFVHALVSLLVNGGLVALNQLTGDRPWFPFPLLGWGIGLAVHGTVVWLRLNTDGLRQRLLAREIERLRSRA